VSSFNPCSHRKSSTLISDDPRQSLWKLASIVGISEPTMRRGGPSIQIVYIKDTTDALWGCQDKPNCSPRLPFWPPNSSDLNPLDYYVWNVIERVTNKSRQCDVIKDRYWGSIRRHGQRYITACVRTLQTKNRVIQANISNNCALQESFKCHVKGFFVIFNFY